ncbi:MAG: tripartite tricarboxylate transporter substrate binding protein [Betaproteobacteria bacterium]|nr:tripartite tricarboxylate transporter substrate binding protein [Betaproteobacteria bacterium]
MMRLAPMLFAAFALAIPMQSAYAQAYPAKPIRVMVPFGPGAPSDAVIRYLADRVTKATGTVFIIDNRVGANGMLAARETAKAAPDGYTMMISSNSAHAANVYLYKDLGYDPVKDFAPITGVTKNPHVLVIRSSLPAQNLKEFMEYGRANPGKLNFGAGNTGAIGNAALLMGIGGFTAVSVSYKSPPQAVLDLAAGRVDFTTIDYFVVAEFIRSGQLRPLGVTSTTRIKALPNVAPISDSYPGYELLGWLATFAPAGTPPNIVAQLNKMLTDVLRTPESEEYFERQGMQIFASTPAVLGTFVQEQIVKWREVLSKAGVERQ